MNSQSICRGESDRPLLPSSSSLPSLPDPDRLRLRTTESPRLRTSLTSSSFQSLSDTTNLYEPTTVGSREFVERVRRESSSREFVERVRRGEDRAGRIKMHLEQLQPRPFTWAPVFRPCRASRDIRSILSRRNTPSATLECPTAPSLCLADFPGRTRATRPCSSGPATVQTPELSKRVGSLASPAAHCRFPTSPRNRGSTRS